ncbi:hypothetical protein RGZ1_132 [Morganella phage vB_MmoM_Rgz1]|nr:hypothetical protein RGZ1_132 [Morganella phage vB_MmoM_Rgz1]
MTHSEKLKDIDNEIDCAMVFVEDEETKGYRPIVLKRGYTEEQLKSFFELIDSISDEKLDNNVTVWFKGGCFAQYTYDYEGYNSTYWWDYHYVLSVPDECL